jgi:hypothetical protein
LKEAGGETRFTPVLSRVKRIPFSKTVQFDIYFYNLADPRALPATSRMIPKRNIFCKDLGKAGLDSLKLKDVVQELEPRGVNRLPILRDGQPLYVVHRSMIDRFVAKRIWTGGGGNVDTYTLADLIGDPDLKGIFENSFVVVDRQASLAEARSAMQERAGCSDVFVTEHGRADEPVIGWLTNVDMTRGS